MERGTMKALQALVAIGGRARRLREGGMEVPITKSFLDVGGRPVLYWNLLSLHIAGVRRLVIASDRPDLRRYLDSVLADLRPKFDRVECFLDGGLGVHGLPYQARDCLKEVFVEETFIFECGHSVMAPRHYANLITAKKANNVVFSAFRPHPENPRQPITLNRGPGPEIWALAHPFVVDGDYVERLPSLGFNISNILRYYGSNGRLSYVFTDQPPEFDIVEEYEASRRCVPVSFAPREPAFR
jgi:hypothetical protein